MSSFSTGTDVALLQAGVADYVHIAGEDHRNQAFSKDEFDRRVQQTQQRMAELDLDVLLVHTPENIYYLSGYETSGYFEYQVLAVPAAGEPELLIRNVEQLNVDAYTWLPHAQIWRDGTDFIEATARIAKAFSGRGRVGIEKHSWFVTAAVAEGLASALPDHDVVACGRLVETIRLVKSPAELVYVRQAATIADLTMAAAVSAAAAGANELAVAAAAHSAQILAGGEYPALPHYVSSGARSELGHATWTDKELVEGELLKMEFLAVKRRYHAGLTRAVHVGPAPADVRHDAQLCLDLQDETFKQLRPGALTDELTRDARDRLAATGRTPIKMRLGYSMGIGFPPIAGEGLTADFREGSGFPLKAGMVFHMLSVLRVGLVFSDTVVITDSGYERLTRTPRVLQEV